MNANAEQGGQLSNKLPELFDAYDQPAKASDINPAEFNEAGLARLAQAAQAIPNTKAQAAVLELLEFMRDKPARVKGQMYEGAFVLALDYKPAWKASHPEEFETFRRLVWQEAAAPLVGYCWAAICDQPDEEK